MHAAECRHFSGNTAENTVNHRGGGVASVIANHCGGGGNSVTVTRLEMALFAATDSWMDSVDSGSYVGALLVDLTKAFDTVPHQLLLTELLEIGCSTQVLGWFCNYLTDRLQRVITYDEVTDWMTVSRGFPQGSGLSPLLFNIFVRKLPQQSTSSTYQFADDTTLAAANPSLSVVADELTASFVAVKEFCDSHDLKINHAKTQLIVFKKPSKPISDDFHLTLDNYQASENSQTSGCHPRSTPNLRATY